MDPTRAGASRCGGDLASRRRGAPTAGLPRQRERQRPARVTPPASETSHNIGVTNRVRQAAEAVRWRHAAAGALAVAAVGEVAARPPDVMHNPSLALILALLGTLPLAAAPAHPPAPAAALITWVGAANSVTSRVSSMYASSSEARCRRSSE